MIQRACGNGFLGESALTIGVAARAIVENLDRDGALQPGVARRDTPAPCRQHRAGRRLGRARSAKAVPAFGCLDSVDERYRSGRGGVNVTEGRMDGSYCVRAAAAAPYT